MQQRRKETRRKIISSTIRLAIDKPDLSLITVEEILEKSGVSRYTFYHEFKNVYDVVVCAKEQVMAENLAIYETIPKPLSPDIAYENFTNFVLKNYDFFYMTVLSSQVNAMQEAYSVARDGIKDSLRGMGVSDERKLEWIFEMMSASATGAIKYWMLNYKPEEREILDEMISFHRECLRLIIQKTVDEAPQS